MGSIGSPGLEALNALRGEEVLGAVVDFPSSVEKRGEIREVQRVHAQQGMSPRDGLSISEHDKIIGGTRAASSERRKRALSRALAWPSVGSTSFRFLTT